MFSAALNHSKKTSYSACTNREKVAPCVCPDANEDQVLKIILLAIFPIQ